MKKITLISILFLVTTVIMQLLAMTDYQQFMLSGNTALETIKHRMLKDDEIDMLLDLYVKIKDTQFSENEQEELNGMLFRLTAPNIQKLTEIKRKFYQINTNLNTQNEKFLNVIRARFKDILLPILSGQQKTQEIYKFVNDYKDFVVADATLQKQIMDQVLLVAGKFLNENDLDEAEKAYNIANDLITKTWVLSLPLSFVEYETKLPQLKSAIEAKSGSAIEAKNGSPVQSSTPVPSPTTTPPVSPRPTIIVSRDLQHALNDLINLLHNLESVL